MGTFEVAGAGGDSNMRTAVHTRVIVDPLWGAKSSGSAGRYGSLVEEQGWDGNGWAESPPLAYRTSQRGAFFKASYIHRF